MSAPPGERRTVPDGTPPRYREVESTLVRAGIEWIAQVEGDADAATDGEGGDETDEGDDEGSWGPPGQELLAKAILEATKNVHHFRTEAAQMEAEARAALVPASDVLDRLQRYESHLARQLSHTLDLLMALQGARVNRR